MVSNIFIYWASISALFIPLFLIALPIQPHSAEEVMKLQFLGPLDFTLRFIAPVYFFGIIPLSIMAIIGIFNREDLPLIKKCRFSVISFLLCFAFPQYYLICCHYKQFFWKHLDLS